MKNFDHVEFKWTFRDYQQKVLDKADEHLRDHHIHIVAAPGSGKTVLGLELIRRLQAPALILSPSVSIRQQWGDRFVECYMPAQDREEDYISYDLTEPSLLTCVTYQALHAALNKIESEQEDEEDLYEADACVDYGTFDLMAAVRSAGIRTLCLDEAHHLKSEWQKALERFIEMLDRQVTVISLTATPPYDATPGEWERYTKVCGAIDEEIFVPQLVKQKTLCPHQDFIYFNYPTQEETQMLKAYRKKAKECAQHLLQEGYMTAALRNAGMLQEPIDEQVLYEHINGFSALAIAAVSAGAELPVALSKKLFGNKPAPAYTELIMQEALQFIIDTPLVFGEGFSDEIRGILSSQSLLERKQVQLSSNEKIDRMLASSMGKLKSIEKIVASEIDNLGSSLRMLVLTDFIKKEVRKSIGTQDALHTMGAVPVFEAVRRKCGDTARVAMLTGSLVILPECAVECAVQLAREEQTQCSVKPIEGCLHSEVVFSGSNKNKVRIITELFSRGQIQILVGTKSLLGEGWDAPNINSLILATFVGSFMLSNQMRGRAIRTDKKNPEKVSDIWHLVTVFPDDERTVENAIEGNDFDTVKRRFSCFQGPAYCTDVICSGIDRIDILKPPFHAQAIDGINQQMLVLAADRKATAANWERASVDDRVISADSRVEVPVCVHPHKKLKNSRIAAVLFFILFAVGIATVAASDFVGKAAGILICIFSLYGLFKKLSFISKNASAEKTVQLFSKAVLRTLQQKKEVEDSSSLRVQAKMNEDRSAVLVQLENASERDKNVFYKAVRELFSPITEPRYVCIGVSSFFGIKQKNYSNSYACPSALGGNKETADLFKKNLKACVGNFEMIYVKSENGKKVLLSCKKQSPLNKAGY